MVEQIVNHFYTSGKFDQKHLDGNRLEKNGNRLPQRILSLKIDILTTLNVPFCKFRSSTLQSN